MTINEHSWDAKDVEQGFVENQAFDAEYMVAASGLASSLPGPLPATLPYQVIYTDSTGSVPLYSYDPTTGLFTALTSTAGRATIASAPFAVQFAGDSAPVVSASTLASMLYRASSPVYRNANTYRQNALLVGLGNGGDGIFAQSPAPADLPRLDFYYGATRTASICRDGLYDVNFTEGSVQSSNVPVGAFSLFGMGGSLVAVLAPGNLMATQIQVS